MAGWDIIALHGEKFDHSSLPANGRLMAIIRFGVGFDKMDLQACADGNVALFTTPNGIRGPMAATVLAFLFALTHQIPQKDAVARAGPSAWKANAEMLGMGLPGRTLGLLGVGNIGGEVFRQAVGLGADSLLPRDARQIDEPGFAGPPVLCVPKEADAVSFCGCRDATHCARTPRCSGSRPRTAPPATASRSARCTRCA
eukprot:SAG11_NODE_1510_length_4770_cov_7.393920_1_plen_199_part_00